MAVVCREEKREGNSQIRKCPVRKSENVRAGLKKAVRNFTKLPKKSEFSGDTSEDIQDVL
jgi:hypothetical protein